MPVPRLKRVYDAPAEADGMRVLVDRLWPRGLSKERAAVDLWLKAIAPSTELRQWFGHEPARWTEFRGKYFAELASHAEDVDRIRKLAKRRRVTLRLRESARSCARDSLPWSSAA